jgi:hypothetical protein
VYLTAGPSTATFSDLLCNTLSIILKSRHTVWTQLPIYTKFQDTILSGAHIPAISIVLTAAISVLVIIYKLRNTNAHSIIIFLWKNIHYKLLGLIKWWRTHSRNKIHAINISFHTRQDRDPKFPRAIFASFVIWLLLVVWAALMEIFFIMSITMKV